MSKGAAAKIKSRLLIAAALVCVLLVVSFYYGLTLEAEGGVEKWTDLQTRPMVHYLRDGLPRDSWHIEYYCHFHSGLGIAIFEISEEKFLSWARNKGWDVQPISCKEFHVFSVGPLRPESIVIQDGYHCIVRKGGLEEQARYDRESGTGYYNVFPF